MRRFDLISTRRLLRQTCGSCALLSCWLHAPETVAELTEGCVALGEALVEHSCFHATVGPFNSVTATMGDSAQQSTPNIDAVHTEHRVGFDRPGSAHVVTYSPQRSGAWIVFTSTELGLEMLSETEEPLPIAFEQHQQTGCDALPVARAFELNANERYTLRLAPSTEDSVVLVIEYGADFLIPSGLDEDGDGYGDPSDTVLTNCQPEPGRAPNALDCDDSDPQIHPDAVERCDDVDRNCNGSPTDEGLPCRVGPGACVATGAFTCVNDTARCEAVPLTASAETCNGIDDDCDGQVDEEADLCVESNPASCVRSGFSAFCGCLLDLDCGPLQSALVCDVETRRCVPVAQPEVDAGHQNDAGRKSDAGAPPDAKDMKPAGLRGVDAAANETCSCRLVGAGRSSSAGWLWLLAATWLVLRRRRSLSTARVVLFALQLLACGAQTTPTNEQDGSTPQQAPAPDGPECTRTLSDELVQHSCSHATFGVFVNVVATSEPSNAPSTNRVHFTYLVTPPDPAQSSFTQSSFTQSSFTQPSFTQPSFTQSSFIEYSPSRQGEHAVFTDQAADLRLSTRTGEPLQPLFFGNVDGCEQLRFATVFDLEQDETYTLALAPVERPPLLLFFEHVESFGAGAWIQRCSR